MSATGNWKITLTTPMGPQEITASLVENGTVLTGKVDSPMGSDTIEGTVNGDKLAWDAKITQPMPMDLTFDVTVSGDTLNGTVKLGMFGDANLTGQRI